MFYRCCLIQWLHNDNYTSNNMSKDRAVKRKFINIPNKKKKKLTMVIVLTDAIIIFVIVCKLSSLCWQTKTVN